jgi:hypothetical protein
MQKLHKLSILTIAVICANYGSILAQDGQKAFKEGDKIFTFGFGYGSEKPLSSITHNGSLNFSKGNEPIGFTPSIAFDYGLKGKKVLLSIGGFLSYSQRTAPVDGGYGFNAYDNYPSNVAKDSIYSILKLRGLKSHTLTAGIRVGLHYSTRKWDFYGGTMVGFQKVITESSAGEQTYHKVNPFMGDYYQIGSSKFVYLDYGLEQIVVNPYVGIRYFITPKVALNLEAEQLKGRVGLSFKF